MTSYSKNIFLPILSLVILLITTSGANAHIGDEYGRLYAALRAEEDSLVADNLASGLTVGADSLYVSGDSLVATLADTLVTDSTKKNLAMRVDADHEEQAGRCVGCSRDISSRGFARVGGG